MFSLQLGRVEGRGSRGNGTGAIGQAEENTLRRCYFCYLLQLVPSPGIIHQLKLILCKNNNLPQKSKIQFDKPTVVGMIASHNSSFKSTDLGMGPGKCAPLSVNLLPGGKKDCLFKTNAISILFMFQLLTLVVCKIMSLLIKDWPLNNPVVPS